MNFKIFGKVKFIKAPARFELRTYILKHPSDPLRYAVIGINFGKEIFNQIIRDFTIYFDKEVHHNMEVSIPP